MARSARTVERVAVLESPCKISPPWSSHTSSWQARGVLPLPRRHDAARLMLLLDIALASEQPGRACGRSAAGTATRASPPCSPRQLHPCALASSPPTPLNPPPRPPRPRHTSSAAGDAARACTRRRSLPASPASAPTGTSSPPLLLRPRPSPATRLAATFSLRAVAPSRRLRPTLRGSRRLTSVALASSPAKEPEPHLQSSRFLAHASSSRET